MATSVVLVRHTDVRRFITGITTYAWLNVGSIVGIDFIFSDGFIFPVGTKTNASLIGNLRFPTGVHEFLVTRRVSGSIEHTMEIEAIKYNPDNSVQYREKISNVSRWPSNAASTQTITSSSRAGAYSVISSVSVRVTDPFYGSPLSFLINLNGAVSDPSPMPVVPINGTWSNWSDWSACNNQQMSRTRTCTPPQNGGLPCVGDAIEFKDCPVDGVFGPWSEWSLCDAKCGSEGKIQRTRTYTPARNGGVELVGPIIEIRTCNGDPCPVDGMFGPWSEWSKCDAKCGSEGHIKRTRTYIPAQHGGRDLTGPLEEIVGCQGDPCPVNGVFGPWSNWSTCNAACGEEGQIRRTRTYIPAQHGGTDITGPLEEIDNCRGPPCPVQAVELIDKPETTTTNNSEIIATSPPNVFPTVSSNESNSSGVSIPTNPDDPNKPPSQDSDQNTSIAQFWEENKTLLIFVALLIVVFAGYVGWRRYKMKQLQPGVSVALVPVVQFKSM